MNNYQVTLIVNINSSLTEEELRNKVVLSLYNFETEQKISDGETDQLQIVEYESVKVFLL